MIKYKEIGPVRIMPDAFPPVIIADLVGIQICLRNPLHCRSRLDEEGRLFPILEFSWQLGKRYVTFKFRFNPEWKPTVNLRHGLVKGER